MHKNACISLKKMEPFMKGVYAKFLAGCATVYEVLQPLILAIWLKVEQAMLVLENNWPEIMDFISQYLRIMGELISQLLWMCVRAIRLYLEYLRR